ASAHGPSVGVVELIKEIVCIAPWEVVFDLLMKVRLDSCRGLFVITLSCQEVVTSLVQDLRSNGRLTAHRINGDNAAFDGKQMEEFRNGRNLIRFGVGFELTHDETTLLRTPCRDHV